MKRFTKKYLMLLMAIVAMMTMSMVWASAEDECNHTLYPSYEGNVVSPTCTTEGYTEVVCGNCNAVIGRVPGKDKPANGHSYTWRMLSSDGGNTYNNNGECSVCHLNTVEKEWTPKLDSNGNVVKDENGEDVMELVAVKYYAVNFYNPSAVETYDESISYTKIVSKRVGMENALLLDVLYVKEGETVKADEENVKKLAKIIPSCEKDIDYGKYKFIGWYDTYVKDPAPPAAPHRVEYNLDTMTVTSNMDLYAGFQGVDISYDVRFYDWNGRALAVAKAVPHGKATVYNLDLPEKEADVKFRYKFNYWAYEGKEVDLTAVYGDVAVRADYISIAREYNVAYYYDETCTEPIINKEVAVKDSKIKYGAEAVNGLAIPRENMDAIAEELSAKDPQYIYAWTGQWVLANRQDYVVSLNSFSVPAGTPDALDGSAEVRLIPKFDKKLKVYELKVTILYPDDNNYHPDELNVQILYANGRIADGRKATKVADDIYEFVSYVNYSPSYTISATAVGYSGTAVSNFVVGPSGAIITLEKVGAFSCGCICHTFMKPIWVRILNLLYTLFGVEHVCCNDMFANIGSSLKYGPGKTN